MKKENKLKIITWLWHQEGSRTKYNANHVNIWAAQVSRHLTIPHTLACVTDMPEGIDPHIEIIPPPNEFINIETPSWTDGKPNCFRRLVLFSPNAEEIFGAKRFVSMDLDVVIAENIDILFDRDDDFVMYKGTNNARPYNGSMLMMNAGARPKVYTDFSLENAILSGQRYTGSDQAWIAFCLGPNERTWSFEDGICWFGSQYNINIPVRRMMFFPGLMKPWEICFANSDPWIVNNYKGEKKGKCLILGYGKTLWTDLEYAVENDGPFENYIISPEVQEYWPHGYLEMAATDNQAIRLAAMHGYTNYTFCGKSEK